ncbi:MAG TPA: flagellar biosynthetic protein FliP [Candidatus Latescibacteria bacterium]|nr:flagellar biosynthetic protein FliP [Gemmatimonadota bacterium]HCR17663.1 flagellar biosynthetic protein FliP [Candidatus Latescibacterota bacterium]|tara:strand:+ start:352 stop:1110 length:759 start_codon:yes stop_codon:yes gene_type:complete
MSANLRVVAFLLLGILLLGSLPQDVQAQGLPRISIEVDESSRPKDVAVTLEIIFLLTVLTLAPALLIMLTSFTRIVVVLSFLRMAIGTQQIPPSQLIIGLSLFLTMFVMGPTFETVYDDAIVPYLDEQIDNESALERGMKPIRAFMLRNTREKDLGLFIKLARLPRPNSPEELSNRVLIPSFVISELKTAFQIAFVLFIPFIIIDMVVASTLLSMGMMMLPPVTVSLPFKILLFVLVDGWHLIVESVVTSFK